MPRFSSSAARAYERAYVITSQRGQCCRRSGRRRRRYATQRLGASVEMDAKPAGPQHRKSKRDVRYAESQLKNLNAKIVSVAFLIAAFCELCPPHRNACRWYRDDPSSLLAKTRFRHGCTRFRSKICPAPFDPSPVFVGDISAVTARTIRVRVLFLARYGSC